MKMVFNKACIWKANKLSIGLSGFSLSEHSQHWGQNKSVITTPLSPIATPTQYQWQGGPFPDLLCFLIFKSFVDFYVCASLHDNIAPHACRNSQRLEEDIGSPGPGAPGSNEHYSGAENQNQVLSLQEWFCTTEPSLQFPFWLNVTNSVCPILFFIGTVLSASLCLVFPVEATCITTVCSGSVLGGGSWGDGSGAKGLLCFHLDGSRSERCKQ